MIDKDTKCFLNMEQYPLETLIPICSGIYLKNIKPSYSSLGFKFNKTKSTTKLLKTDIQALSQLLLLEQQHHDYLKIYLHEQEFYTFDQLVRILTLVKVSATYTSFYVDDLRSYRGDKQINLKLPENFRVGEQVYEIKNCSGKWVCYEDE